MENGCAERRLFPPASAPSVKHRYSRGIRMALYGGSSFPATFAPPRRSGSKLHQVVRNEHGTGEVLLNLFDEALVIVLRIGRSGKMRQHHSFDGGASRHLAYILWRQVLFRHMPDRAG